MIFPIIYSITFSVTLALFLLLFFWEKRWKQKCGPTSLSRTDDILMIVLVLFEILNVLFSVLSSLYFARNLNVAFLLSAALCHTFLLGSLQIYFKSCYIIDRRNLKANFHSVCPSFSFSNLYQAILETFSSFLAFFLYFLFTSILHIEASKENTIGLLILVVLFGFVLISSGLSMMCKQKRKNSNSLRTGISCFCFLIAYCSIWIYMCLISTLSQKDNMFSFSIFFYVTPFVLAVFYSFIQNKWIYPRLYDDTNKPLCVDSLFQHLTISDVGLGIILSLMSSIAFLIYVHI